MKRPGPVSSRKVATIRSSPDLSYFWLMVAGPHCFREDSGKALGVKPAGKLMRYCNCRMCGSGSSIGPFRSSGCDPPAWPAELPSSSGSTPRKRPGSRSKRLSGWSVIVAVASSNWPIRASGDLGRDAERFGKVQRRAEFQARRGLRAELVLEELFPALPQGLDAQRGIVFAKVFLARPAASDRDADAALAVLQGKQFDNLFARVDP